MPARDLEPVFGTIAEWRRISGMGQTSVYAALKRGDLKAIKLGRRTLIDIQAGLNWLRMQAPWKPTVGDRSER